MCGSDDDLRELFLAELILECAAIRHASRYDAHGLAELRAANERLQAAGDPAAAEEAFHRLLVAPAPPRVRWALEPLRRALRPHRVEAERCAVAHEGVIRALERGNHGGAERRLRRHLLCALPRTAPQAA